MLLFILTVGLKRDKLVNHIHKHEQNLVLERIKCSEVVLFEFRNFPLNWFLSEGLVDFVGNQFTFSWRTWKYISIVMPFWSSLVSLYLILFVSKTCSLEVSFLTEALQGTYLFVLSNCFKFRRFSFGPPKSP